MLALPLGAAPFSQVAATSLMSETLKLVATEAEAPVELAEADAVGAAESSLLPITATM